MTTVKNVEDLTFEEVKEQLALHKRLYYALKQKNVQNFLLKSEQDKEETMLKRKQEKKRKLELREKNRTQTKNTLLHH